MTLATRERFRQLALVQRDASGAPEQPSGPKLYKFRANDAQFDRYQDRNSVQGWKLDAFNANPVILFNHDDGTGGILGMAPKMLPIGKGRAYVEGDALMVDIAFDPNDAFAKQIESKVEGGFLNAVSVRYLIAGDYTENEKGGIDSSEQELLEISVVTLPGNQRAVRVKGLEGAEQLINQLADAIAKRLAPPAPAPVPEPKAAPINPNELAAMVAEHFTKSKESR